MIILEGIKKSYGEKEVLKGVTLEVKKHELLSLVGPSGCGKTTTLNVVSGLCQPDEGTVVLDDVLVDGRSGGRLVHANPSERKVGYVFQEYSLFPHMTVSDNVSYGPKARHRPEKEVKERTHSLLQFVGLLDHAQHYPPQLSGGQKQRIALARALATEPDILLLDEPLAALDPRTRETLRTDLKKMLGTLDVTTVYVTHELAEAYTISDKIAVMGPGKIEQIGYRDEIFTKPNSEFVAQFLGENVYNGKVVNPSGPVPTIEINGVEISARIPAEANGAVLVTLRPEDIAISPQAGTNDLEWNGSIYNNLKGTIVEIVRMRSFAEVTVDVGFQVKSLITSNSIEELGFREGERVQIHFKRDSLGISPIS
jgi:molybdopterin-binding protein